jgi:hypothetical protein
VLFPDLKFLEVQAPRPHLLVTSLFHNLHLQRQVALVPRKGSARDCLLLHLL